MRPDIPRREANEAQYPSEEFIVPLIRGRIGTMLEVLAAQGRTAERVLDIGCGAQPFRKQLQSLGFQYQSLDVQQNPAGSVDFLCEIDGDLPAALRAESPFDLLLCTEVLEHVADWDAAFKNLAALTASNGHVVISCPHFYALHEVPYDFWRATPFSVRYFAERAGFSVCEIAEAGTPWDVLGTFLGTIRPVSVDSRPQNRFIARAVVRVMGLAFRILKGRLIQDRVRLEGSLYLSNVALIRKREELPVSGQ